MLAPADKPPHQGFSTFHAYGPINKQTEPSGATDYTTSPMRQLLHMHTTEIKPTFNNATCATINAKSEHVCC